MKEVLTALVVDDERLARMELISMLKPFTGIEVIGEADCVDEAVRLIKRQPPDLIFLDIQMPGKSGFDLLETMQIDAKIVFVTAYDEYAIRAFEVNAMDYLPKPVSEKRLENTIAKVISSVGMPVVPARKLKYADRLFLEFGTQIRFLKMCDIVLISSEGDYSVVHLANGNKGLVSKSMKEWEERLPEDFFCRIHRCSIVNIEFIESIDKYFNNSLKVKMKGLPEPLIISRRYAKKLKGLYG